mgnify:FL=1
MESGPHADVPKKRGRKPSGLTYCKLCKIYLHKCRHGKGEVNQGEQEGTATRSQSNVEILELGKKRKVEKGKLGHAMRELKKLKRADHSDKRRQFLDKIQAADEAIKLVCFKQLRLCTVYGVRCTQLAQVWLNLTFWSLFFLLLLCRWNRMLPLPVRKRKKPR